ncbi:Peptidyl-prolyl cis-trans isomerase-like 3 [Candida viswanathii]|uniref:Peptidyl-prolyl cis-trans isomerase-like 3 n=1 Tax=Candida viswanathii TaxID=5486 RepID=A0A367YFS8_9ASCO|nr:Peptidyl-prolyl cis-trans isomerase-like 3 [Candida viswanathii]
MSLTFYTKTGNLKVELYLPDEPALLENFLRHFAKGTYNNVKVLRYIPDFILQTGSPINKGKDNRPADPKNKPTGRFSDKLLHKNPVKRGTLFTINNAGEGDRLETSNMVGIY